MKKRALSLILALVLVVGLLPMTAFAASVDLKSGTISTAEQFIDYISSNGVYKSDAAAKIVLKNDIDLGGAELTPVGAFAATFDGQGHTVSNFKLSAPLFGIVRKSGCIKNLTVKDVTLNNTLGNQPRLGIICQNLNGTMENVRVENCTITSEEEALGVVGGLAAMTQNGCSANNCSVSGLTVNAAKGATAVGGAFGLLLGACSVSDITASSVTVKGNALKKVDAQEGTDWGTAIGGLWGIDKGEASVTNCYGTEPDISGFQPVAAIGSVYYDTLQDAFDAATDGDTVKVVRDISVSLDDMDVQDVEAKGKTWKYHTLARIKRDLTLDLNGHTISFAEDAKTADCSENPRLYRLFYIRDGANVVVKGNGTIDAGVSAEDVSSYIFVIKNNANVNLTIEDGEYYASTVVHTYGTNTCIINGGRFGQFRDSADPKFLLNNQGSKNLAFFLRGGTYIKADPRNMNDGNMVDEGYMVIQNGNEYTVVPEFSNAFIAILDDVPFVDVSANHYFYDAVKWAYHEGVTGGTDAWHFSPDAGCTRAQIVTFLWRAAGCPSATYLGNFSDVDADAYYATAVAWAVENGITNGTSATTFSPEAVCTRADAVTFLYRAFGRNPNYTANFTDVPANAYFADAVAWAAENNVTGGTGNGKFSPADTCSRAQIVTFLYRTLG